MQTHYGTIAELPNRRAWAAADRQGARPGTAIGMPAVPCKGAGRGVDQVEGDELNLVGRTDQSSLVYRVMMDNYVMSLE